MPVIPVLVKTWQRRLVDKAMRKLLGGYGPDLTVPRAVGQTQQSGGKPLPLPFQNWEE